MEEVDVVHALSQFLTANWGEPFAFALNGNLEASAGFALARGISLGWAAPGPDASQYLDAARSFRQIWEAGESSDGDR